MAETELPLSTVINIAEAIVLIGDCTLLDATTSYKLGRLGDQLKSPVTHREKQREKLNKDKREKQKKAIENNTKKGDTQTSKTELSIELAETQQSYQEALDALDQESSGNIRIPEFKLSEFTAKTDIVIEENGKKVTIKTGQSLVPVKFFTLMGELIKES